MLAKERYEQIAYVAILNDDSTLKMGIPLYVKVLGDVSPQQQKLINDTATELVRKYDKQIGEYFKKLKREQAKQ